MADPSVPVCPWPLTLQTVVAELAENNLKGEDGMKVVKCRRPGPEKEVNEHSSFSLWAERGSSWRPCTWPWPFGLSPVSVYWRGISPSPQHLLWAQTVRTSVTSIAQHLISAHYLLVFFFFFIHYLLFNVLSDHLEHNVCANFFPLCPFSFRLPSLLTLPSIPLFFFS